MNDYLIELTKGELLVFLAIMGSATMNGLDDDLFRNLGDLEIAEHLNSGEQSLINRGLLIIDDDTAALDDTLVALVGSSVVPDATFLLTRIEPDGSNDVHYFNATPELLVEQTSPRPGIHVFAYLPDAEALDCRLEALLAPLRSLSGLNIEDLPAELSISADIMARFVEQCRQDGSDTAQQTLEQAGWPEEAARRLAHDCATYPFWMGVVAWNLRNGEPKGLDPVMVCHGDDYCWFVENAENDPELLRLRPVSGIQCQTALSALAEPLQEIYLSN